MISEEELYKIKNQKLINGICYCFEVKEIARHHLWNADKEVCMFCLAKDPDHNSYDPEYEMDLFKGMIKK
jgi:hypothetical protein